MRDVNCFDVTSSRESSQSPKNGSNMRIYGLFSLENLIHIKRLRGDKLPFLKVGTHPKEAVMASYCRYGRYACSSLEINRLRQLNKSEYRHTLPRWIFFAVPKTDFRGKEGELFDDVIDIRLRFHDVVRLNCSECV